MIGPALYTSTPTRAEAPPRGSVGPEDEEDGRAVIDDRDQRHRLFTPAESISNAELVASFNAYVEATMPEDREEIAAGDREPLAPSSADFIEHASGIRSRYVLDKSGVLDPTRMTPRIAERPESDPSIQCEMAVIAARGAMETAGRSPDEIDAVLVACSNLQRAYPAIAIEVQAALGVQGFAYDMNVACSSATFAIQAAAQAVATGAARRVLVASPEICSGHLDFRDRDCHFIFGDACTAVLVEDAASTRSDDVYEILGTKLATSFSSNIRNDFGFLNRCDESGVGARDKLFHQNGRKVFREIVPASRSTSSTTSRSSACPRRTSGGSGFTRPMRP